MSGVKAAVKITIAGEHQVKFLDARQAGHVQGDMLLVAGCVEKVVNGSLQLVGFVEHGMDATRAGNRM